MAFTRILQAKNTMHLPTTFRTAEERASVIRDLQGRLARATGDDVQSLKNRIAKARSIGVRK
jgi:hypothetical protein